MSENPVRREIVAQHDEMREMVREVRDLADRCEQATAQGPDLGKQLHDRGLALYEKFRVHLDREQELLGPVLQAAGSEGRRLGTRLANEHREQRELLQYLLGRLSQNPPTLLIARELKHFTDFLHSEMSEEEETLLSPGILGGDED